MLIHIDRTSRIPLYQQIAQQTRELILSGALREGMSLPASRKLAETLGVGRKTVEDAYRILRTEGLISGNRRRGTKVRSLSEENAKGVQYRPAIWSKLSSGRTIQLYYQSLHNRLFEGFSDECIVLRHERVLTGLVPVDLALEASREAILEADRDGALEVHLRGLPDLRSMLADRLEFLGLRLHRDQIMVVSGRQQGLFLVSLALLKPGDQVAMPVPCYSGHTQAFRSMGAKIHEVPLDGSGPDLEHLEGLFARYPIKLMIVSPTFRNPTGTTIPLKRRQELIDLASRYRVVMLEDDSYGSLRIDGRAIPPMGSMDGMERSIYLSSLEYELPIGLHLAFVAVPERVMKLLLPLKMALEKSAPALTQSMAAFLLSRRSEVMPQFLAKLRDRRDALIDELEKTCRSWMEWGEPPEGGAFLWTTLQEDMNALEVSAHALSHGVNIIPGEIFFPGRRGGERNLRLDFIGLPPDQLREGVRRLAKTLRDFSPGTRS